MNISELYNLTQWIQEEIVKKQIPQKYQNLQTILQQNSQPRQQNQPFENQKKDLIESLITIAIYKLTQSQLIFLEELNILTTVGNQGVSMLEDILYKNVIDIATSAQDIAKIIQNINGGIAKSKQIQTGLSGCVPMEDYEVNNEVLMRVSFTGHASMSNVTDFKNWGNIWYDIGRGIAMAHDETPENVKIIGATKGSIIIELAVIASIAATTSGIILSALKVAEKVLDIRKKAAEIKNLNLQNKNLANDIDKEADNEKKIEIENISTEIIKQLKLKKDSQGDIITALNKAIKNLVNFIESGGEVDFILPDEENDDEEENKQISNYKELKSTFQEIRTLENKIKLLEIADI